MTMHDEDLPEACEPGDHWFDRSRITNEPIGRCIKCSASLEWAEAQEEGDPAIGEDPTDLIPESLVEDGFTADKQGLIDWGLASPETFGLVVA